MEETATNTAAWPEVGPHEVCTYVLESLFILRECAHMRVSGGGAERERGSQAGSTLSAEPDVGLHPVKREITTGAEIKSGRSTD